MDPKRIAVIGATGMLGKPVTRELIAAGHDVTLIARHPDQARSDFPNTRFVPGDVLDAESLRTALQGQDAVYLSLSTAPGEKPDQPHTETDGLRNVVAAAKENGVGRIAFLSSVVKNYQGQNGFHWWVFDVKGEAVRTLKESGLPYTIFYPSSFMENFTHGYLQGDRIMLAGKSRYPMYFIAGRDYGTQVARSFELLDGESREYVVQGPEPFRADEAARVFAQHYTARDLKITRLPLWPLKLMGIVNPEMRYTSRILDALNRYPERFAAQNTWDELGQPTTTLAEFAREVSERGA